MAERIEAELCCPVCLATYQEPVSLSCGHCFCKPCITETLCHQKAEGRACCTCPVCQAPYQDFPAMIKNLPLCNIVENYLSMQTSPEDGQLSCGDCLDHLRVAVKTCVTCEVLLCQEHLVRHMKKGHTLLEPTASVEERKCPEHDKLLEYYCGHDNSCICVTCYITGKHKGHTIITLKQAHEKQLATLSATTSSLSARVSALHKDINDLNAGLLKIPKNTIKLSKPLEELRDRIILLVNGLFKETALAISNNQAQASSKITGIIKKMEDAKAATEKLLSELNLMSKQPDDLQFIKVFKSSQVLITQQSSQINTIRVVDVEADKTIMVNIDKKTTDYIDSIGQHLKYIQNVFSQQVEDLVWSGNQRIKVQKQQPPIKVQIQQETSKKMDLMFPDSYTHCLYTVSVSNQYKTLTATVHGQQYRGYGNAWNRGYGASFNTDCKCKLPVVIPDCIIRNTSPNKLHCLVDISESNDWCVGVISQGLHRYLQWNGNCLSYESETSLSLGTTKITILKMQLVFDTNLLGFYDASQKTEIPILICKCQDVFTEPVSVGFNILDGSLSLI